nr:immunoglobulin light chain junction region [Macaca mulatta]MOW29181.1 immunoglobulin light chain junction region [Macaca mulatta]
DYYCSSYAGSNILMF